MGAERGSRLDAAEAGRATAEAAVRSRDQMLGVVSHDLRNALTVIQMQAQLLQEIAETLDHEDASVLRSGLAEIETTSERVKKQLDELTDVTRFRLGSSPEMALQEVDLAKALERIISAYQQTTPNHRIRFESAVPSLTGALDEVRIERVFENLLSNAVKYSPEGGDVVVTLRREGEEPRIAAVTVTDEGVGIAEEDLPHIFEPYWRSRSVADEIPGTGLGLESVRHIVESHGGTVEVASKVGAGSAFTVRLPIRPVPGMGPGGQPAE